MKNTIMTMVCAFVWATLSAQVEFREEMGTHGFMKETDHAVFFWRKMDGTGSASGYRYELAVHNRNLEFIISHEFEVTVGTSFTSAQSGLDFSIIQLKRGDVKILLSIDPSGKIIARKEVTRAEDEKRGPFFQVSSSSVYLVKEIKEKQHGYTLSCFDKYLKEQWNHTQMPEKGRYTFKEARADGSGMTILHDYQKNSLASDKPYVSKVDQSGKQLFNNEIPDLPVNFKLKHFKLLKNGEAVIAGTYNSGVEKRKGKKGDIYYVHFSKDGTLKKALDIADLDLSMVAVRPENAFSYPDDKATFSLAPLALVERENGIEIFCEAYIFTTVVNPESGNVTSASYYSLDFYSILINDKEPVISQLAKNYSVYNKTTGMFITFEDTRVIGSHRLHHEQDGHYYFTSLHNGYPYLGVVTLGNPYESVASRIYLTEEPLSDFTLKGNLVSASSSAGNHSCSFIWNKDNYISYSKTEGVYRYSINPYPTINQ